MPDRAGELRGSDLAPIIARDGAETILMWRGKPLTQKGDLMPLVRLGMDHPVLEGARQIFLGRERGKVAGRAGRLLFAHDISDWTPGDDLEALDTFLDPSEQRHP